MSYWNEVYKKVEALFGREPDYVLSYYSKLFPEGKVLDLGAGEGRNSIFLAEKGFHVVCVDGSSIALEKCAMRARERGVSVECLCCDLRKYEVEEEAFTVVICAWVLNFFKLAEARRIVEKAVKGLKRGGYFYLAVLSVKDPGYAKAREKFREVEDRTFYLPKFKSYMHYFTVEEVKELVEGLRVIVLLEGVELDLTHDEPHYHGVIYFLGEKS